jgi:hypothetical protein
MTPERFDQLRALAMHPSANAWNLGEALDEIARLAADVYVPGSWFCPRCGFSLTRSVIYAESGSIGIDHRHPDPCPNDGTSLEPATWKRDAMQMAERMPDANCMQLINELRQNEGATVTLCSDNADFNGLPNCLIEVNDHWTGWLPRQFRADRLIQALHAAVAARRAADQKPEAG